MYENDHEIYYTEPTAEQKARLEQITNCVKCSMAIHKPVLVDNTVEKIYLDPSIKYVHEMRYSCPLHDDVEDVMINVCYSGNKECDGYSCKHCIHNCGEIIAECNPAMIESINNKDKIKLKISRVLSKCDAWGHRKQGLYHRTNFVCDKFERDPKK